MQDLAQAIKLNNGLIQATLLVENLRFEELDDLQVIAQCACYPPKLIQINLSIVEKLPSSVTSVKAHLNDIKLIIQQHPTQSCEWGAVFLGNIKTTYD